MLYTWPNVQRQSYPDPHPVTLNTPPEVLHNGCNAICVQLALNPAGLNEQVPQLRQPLSTHQVVGYILQPGPMHWWVRASATCVLWTTHRHAAADVGCLVFFATCS